MLLAYLRLVSPECVGSVPGGPDCYGALLYDNWVLDVPKLLDIAVGAGPFRGCVCARALIVR